MVELYQLVALVEFAALVETVAAFALAWLAVFHYAERSVVAVPKATTARPTHPLMEAVRVQLLRAPQPPKETGMYSELVLRVSHPRQRHQNRLEAFYLVYGVLRLRQAPSVHQFAHQLLFA